MALVLLLTVFVDLITAVAVGVFLAALAFVKRIADEQLANAAEPMPRMTTDEEKILLERAKGRVTMFDFGGPLSFGAAADLGHQMRERSKKTTEAMILDFSRVPFIDVSAARAVETIACDAKQAGKLVYVSGIKESVREILSGLGADHCLPVDTEFDNRLLALQAAVERVTKDDGQKAASTPAPA